MDLNKEVNKIEGICKRMNKPKTVEMNSNTQKEISKGERTDLKSIMTVKGLIQVVINDELDDMQYKVKE